MSTLFTPEEGERNRSGRIWLVLVTAWVVLSVALWAAYHWEPLRIFVSIERLTDLSRPLARHPAAPLVIAGAYFSSVLIVFPRAVLTLPAVVVFGPWLTFFSGMSGLLLGALCGLWFGRKVSRQRVRMLARSQLVARLETKIRQSGVGAVLLVRLVPVAPFTVVNVALGALRIRTGDFVAGTFLGLLPGFLFTIFLGDRVRMMLDTPRDINPLLLLAQIGGAAAVLLLLIRLASAKFKEKPAAADPPCAG